MTRYVEFDEPFCFKENGPYTISQTVRIAAADVIAWQRWREPRYESDEQALEDFLTVHWARIVEVPDAPATK